MSDDFSSSDATQAKDSPGSYLKGFQIALISTFAVIFVYFAAQTAGSMIVSLLSVLLPGVAAHSDSWLKDSTIAQFIYGLLADGFMLVGVIAVMKWFGWTWHAIGLKSPRAWHVLCGALMAVPYYIFLYALVIMLGKLFPSLNVTQKQELGFDTLDGGLSIFLAFLSLVIIPPFVEEVIMRGFLYTGIRKLLPKVFAALVVSAIFGAAHLAEGGSGGPLWIGAIDTFTLSLFLVALRELTGNLWAGITLHAVKNGLAFVSFLVLRLH